MAEGRKATIPVAEDNTDPSGFTQFIHTKTLSLHGINRKTIHKKVDT